MSKHQLKAYDRWTMYSILFLVMSLLLLGILIYEEMRGKWEVYRINAQIEESKKENGIPFDYDKYYNELEKNKDPR